MLEKLKVSVRDAVLAGVAAFVGAMGVVLSGGDFSYPVVKAAAIAAVWAGIRVAIGVFAAKFSK